MPFIGGFRAVGFTQSVRRYPAFIEDLPPPDLTGVVLRDGSQNMSAPWNIGAQPFTNSAGFQINDNAFLALGDVNDSIIAYDGTNTIWTVNAVGTGLLQIKTNAQGTFPAVTTAYALVVGGSTFFGPSAAMAIVSYSGASCILAFGDEGDVDVGNITYSHSANVMSFTAGTVLGLSIGAASVAVGSGLLNTEAFLVDQPSLTGARPVLALDQADVSEPMIDFRSTIGVGNAIEAVGAKVLTPTHFIMVELPGGLIRHFEVGTIA